MLAERAMSTTIGRSYIKTAHRHRDQVERLMKANLGGRRREQFVTISPDTYLDGFLRKLGRLADLCEVEERAIRALPFKFEEVGSHHYLVREGHQITRCCLLVDGYACRHKMSRQGKRQIVSFQMPGDLLDLQHSLLPRADHNVQAVTKAIVGWVPIPALKALVRDFPVIAEAFGKDALIDASIFREWVLNVGTRDARTRVAHMLCEFVPDEKPPG